MDNIPIDKLKANREFLSYLIRDLFFLSLENQTREYFSHRRNEYNDLFKNAKPTNIWGSNLDKLYDAFGDYFYDRIITHDGQDFSTVNMEKLDDFIKFIRNTTNIDLPGPMRVLRLNIEDDTQTGCDNEEEDNDNEEDGENDEDDEENFVNLKPYYSERERRTNETSLNIKKFETYSNISENVLLDTIRNMDFVRLLREWTGIVIPTPGVYPSITTVEISGKDEPVKKITLV